MTHHLVKTVLGFMGTAVCLVALLGAAQMGLFMPQKVQPYSKADLLEIRTKKEIKDLGLDKYISPQSVQDLLLHQRKSGQSLVQILKDPNWSRRVGLQPESFKATWYIANPFDLLPRHLRKAIQKKKIPFFSRTHVWQWCRSHNVPRKWVNALYSALIETTPHNLWRASRGQRPITRNGELLKPIVVDRGNGRFVVQNGHIAIDPRVIPMNSELFLIVKVNGKDQILRVKAADTGGAIKGWHVDLPIHIHSASSAQMPYTRLPSAAIRNSHVQVLIPFSAWNRARLLRKKSNLDQTA